MLLDSKTNLIPPENPSLGVDWDGSWGAISPVPHSIETLCIFVEKQAGKPCLFYYPYRTIEQWNWSLDATETLEIQVGGVQLIIAGTGLRRLAEALNMGQLRLVRLTPSSPDNEEICIRSIQMTDGSD